MKTLRLILLAFSLIFSINTQAQIDSSIHEELREFLINLKRAPCTTQFLYDLAAHSSNDTFYRVMCTDTNNTYNWYQIYYEMFHSSYTRNFIPHDSIVEFNADDLTYQTQKIPLGLMDFDFNSIRSDAWDSVNFGRWYIYTDDTIIDNPTRIDEPFIINPENPVRGTCNEIFNFSPLQQSSYFRDVTFTIDPGNFFFYSAMYSSNVLTHPAPHTFQIDLDDGAGWRIVDPFNFSEISTVYPDSGWYYPKARVLTDGIPIKFSLSSFFIEQDAVRVVPDETWTNIPGLKIHVYKNCNDDGSLKPIIFLSGIDILEVRTPEIIYRNMIQDNRILMLKNLGYDILIVDWNDSKIDMKINADRVRFLLDYLKDISDSSHQFVMIGESMGGVIGRYVLTYMETSDYVDMPRLPEFYQRYKPWRMHNTRLFISIDAPHRGANIPLAYQYMSDWLYSVPRPIIRSCMFFGVFGRKAHNISSNVLKQKAVKQLLIYHRNTRNGSGEHTEHSDRTDFMNDLIAMNTTTGGWPAHCKIMLETNGLMDGRKQMGYNNDTLFGNDRIIEFDKLHITVRIFKVIPIPIYICNNIKLKANPEGSGNVIEVPSAFSMLGPTGFFRGCLTKIFRPFSSPCTVLFWQLPFTVNVNSSQASDIWPGGTQPAGSWIIDGSNNVTSKKWWLKSKFFDNDEFAGTFNIKRTYGVRFIINGSMVLEGSSDFPNHCFIPLQSALDYSVSAAPLSPYHNIINNPVSTNMSRTFVNVIVGWRTNISCYQFTSSLYSNYYQGLVCKNLDHMQWRKDVLASFSPSVGNYLGREIGDEEMWLDNMNLNREAIYQAKNIISAGNDENRLYYYPTHNSLTSSTWDGMHSDDQKFVIDSFDIGQVEFIAGDEIRLRTGFESLRHSKFRAHIDSMQFCNLEFIELGGDSNSIVVNNTSVDKLSNDPNSGVIIYPNPSNGKIDIKTNGFDILSCSLFDLKGSNILIEISRTSQNHISIDCNFIANGVYLLKINTSNGTIKYFKIIINH